MQQENNESSDNVSGDGQELLSVLQSYTFSVLVKSPNVDSIKTFIDTFEQSERFYKILSMETTSGEEDAKPLTYQMEIRTYYQK
ncbi:hypothetical protein ACJROX_20650 [Pseudalkalibacillus sp. A8]|uniref:hypothetical protein n=1 Tax=Pseudalkalibacillus sp. A8 TaxID=3382641 RepID=UPI0038B5A019